MVKRAVAAAAGGAKVYIVAHNFAYAARSPSA